MKLQPLVSIIMPAFNSEKYISKSIDSVLNQSWENWELLIVDDNSTDKTTKIIKHYSNQDERIILFKNKLNLGPAVSRNLSIENSKGRFIAFLDSDDWWVRDKLQKQINFMLLNNYPFTYTDYWITGSNETLIKKRGIPSKISYKMLLKTNYIGCLTAIYDTKLIGKQFMPLIKKRQDFGLWLKILKNINFAYGLDKPLAYYRIHTESISANKLDAAKYTWYLYRNIENLNFFHSLYYFLNYSIRGILRK